MIVRSTEKVLIICYSESLGKLGKILSKNKIRGFVKKLSYIKIYVTSLIENF